jgi:two-component system OmpR family response regulator
MALRVLYVEDEVILAVMTAAAIEEQGFEVEMAHDGQQGLERARAFRPDVVVTDYMMPGMDGLEMVRALRDEGIDAPVILTTAIPESQFSPGALDAVDAYLGKPFDDERLIATLHRLGDPSPGTTETEATS